MEVFYTYLPAARRTRTRALQPRKKPGFRALETCLTDIKREHRVDVSVAVYIHKQRGSKKARSFMYTTYEVLHKMTSPSFRKIIRDDGLSPDLDVFDAGKQCVVSLECVKWTPVPRRWSVFSHQRTHGVSGSGTEGRKLEAV
jgi:hypothetical protein